MSFQVIWTSAVSYHWLKTLSSSNGRVFAHRDKNAIIETFVDTSLTSYTDSVNSIGSGATSGSDMKCKVNVSEILGLPDVASAFYHALQERQAQLITDADIYSDMLDHYLIMERRPWGGHVWGLREWEI